MNLNTYILLQREICLCVCTHVKLFLQTKVGYPAINSLQEFVLLILLFSSKQSNGLRTCHFITVEVIILLSALTYHLSEKCPLQNPFCSKTGCDIPHKPSHSAFKVDKPMQI